MTTPDDGKQAPDPAPIPPRTDALWSRRQVVATGIVLLWSMPVITTIALGSGGTTKQKSCPPGRKRIGGKCV